MLLVILIIQESSDLSLRINFLNNSVTVQLSNNIFYDQWHNKEKAAYKYKIAFHIYRHDRNIMIKKP